VNKYFLRISKFLRLKRKLPWLVGLGLFLIVISLWYRLWTGEQEYHQQLIHQEVLEANYVFNTQLNARVSGLEKIARHWQIHHQLYGETSQKVWEVDALSYDADYPDCVAIAHINTQGKIDWTFPKNAQIPPILQTPIKDLSIDKESPVILKLVTADPPVPTSGIHNPSLKNQELPTYNLLVFIPVTQFGSSQEDLIVAVIQVKTLVDNLLQPKIARGVNARVFVDEQEIYRSIQDIQDIHNIHNIHDIQSILIDKSLSTSFIINLHNTKWQVLLQFPSTSITQQRRFFLPWIVLLGGAILSFFLGGLIHFAQTSNHKTRQISRINQNLKREIQQRQLVEIDLRKQQEILQAVFDHIPIMLALYDRQGQVHWINQELEKSIGWSTADYQDHDAFKLSYPDPQDQEKLATHMMEPTGQWLDVVTKTRDGRTIATSWTNITLSDGSYVGIGQDITERKQTEKLLLQRIQQKRALSQVVATIRNSLDIPQVFTTAVKEIAHLLKTDRAAIVEYRSQESLWVTVAAYREDPSTIDDLEINNLEIKIPDQDHPVAAQLKKLKVIRLGNSAYAENQINQELAKTFPGTWLLVPLHFQGVVWGSLSLVRNDLLNEWSEREVEIAINLADQLSIAIHQSQLHQELQHFTANLERQINLRTLELQRALSFEATLKRITDKVRDSLDQNQILQTVVEELLAALEVDCCNTVLYSSDHLTATITQVATRAGISSSLSQVLETSEFPDIHQYLDQGEHIVFCQLKSQDLPDYAAIFACPIIDDHGSLGELWLFKPAFSSFGDMEVRLVEQVVNQCAIAIRQSQLYQAAQQQVTELEKLNLLKDDFLKTISHELRTPIASIKIATEMLEILIDQSGVFQDKLQGMEPYFMILRDEATKEEKLINDLLYLTCLESGTEPLDLIPIQLQYWIPYVTDTFLERTSSQQQELRIEIPPDFPELVTDVSILERIIGELLNNACKYTPAGETISLIAKIVPSDSQDVQLTNTAPLSSAELETKPPANHIKISVVNSGVEIPEEERERIFDKFYRIPNRDPWRYGGTGLGLALVRKLAHYLGATIEVASNQGQTCFTIDLGEVCPIDSPQQN
jgi:PAS domain S-box-containing protein